MKSIILGVTTVVLSVGALTAPVGATSAINGGLALGGNSAASIHKSGSMGAHIGPDGVSAHFDGENTYCFNANHAMQGGFTIGNVAPINIAPTSIPSADANNCGPTDVVNNPPENTTVTINGVCGDPAELAKFAQAHSNVIINSVGVCNDKPVTPVVTVTPTPSVPTTTVVTASATTPATPAVSAVSQLPQTGSTGMVGFIAAAGSTTYALAFAVVRTLRARTVTGL